MKSIFKVFILIIIQVFVSFSAYGQEKFHDYFTSPEDRKQHRSFYSDYAKEVLCIEPEHVISGAYYDRINITKAHDFSEIGVNVISYLSSSNYDYQRTALVSPMIVEGVVIKKDDDKNRESKSYYSYLVKINEVLFDDLGFCLDTVKVRLGFGDRGDIHYLSGDKVILFLEPLILNINSLLTLLKEEFNEEELNDFLKKRLSVSFSEINEHATIIKGLEITDEFVFNQRKNIGSKTDILKQIRSIVEINNRDDFYKIHR